MLGVWLWQGEEGAEVWPFPFWSECLRLRRRSKPRLSGVAPTLARRRLLCPDGGGLSSPSS